MSEMRQLLAEDGIRSINDSSYVKALVNKWGKLLSHLPSATAQQRYALGTTAMLLENQISHMRQSRGTGLTEDVTSTANVGPYQKYIFPVLMRVFPNLIANEIVSVQPMAAPVGAVFFLDYIYATNKGGTTAGNVFPRDFDKYYTSEYVDGEPLATGNASAFGGVGTTLAASLAFTPVRPLDTTRGYRLVIREINSSTGAVVQEAVDNGSGAFTGNVTGTPNFNYSNGALTGFLFTNAPATGNQIKAYYHYDMESNERIPQMTLDVKKAVVEAQTRKIKAVWSSESAEDMRAFHGVDAEGEIISAVAQEMALEIDRDILTQLQLSATQTTASFDRIPPAGIAEIDHLRSLLTTISTVSNLIHKRTLRAPANWMVTSPEVSALLTQLTTHGDFRAAYVSGSDSPYGPADTGRPLTSHGQYNIYKVGTLMNKITLYEDPFFTRDKILVGLKGSSYMDSGFAFAPYVPMQITSTFQDPNDFNFRKGVRTRYATKLLRPEYYGQITVTNL